MTSTVITKNNDFEIPIDGAIGRFYDHLKNHDRTILSAKFGDGKSYFLQKFMADEKVRENYVFLTLFPVNYQVEENRDVFELIKYDLLIQMFVQKIMEPDFKMSKVHAWGWCLQLNAPTLVEGLLPIFSSLYLDEASAKMMAAFLIAHKTVGKIKKKTGELMEPVRDRHIENFIKEIAKNPVSGQDVVTVIIQQGIAAYKKDHPDKKIVLIIEDMDRMDPAHLFRIMNVFSAHIDYNYRFGVNANQPFIGNKFGLDKVVFVMSYENTEHIFHHFYGRDADFNGYISKFCSSNIFNYSHSPEKEKIVYMRISENTKVDESLLRYLVKPELLYEHSIREVVNAIEGVEGFVNHVQVSDKDGQTINLHHGILKVIAILRKLGMDNKDIKDRITACLGDEKVYKPLLGYLGCFMAYARRGRLDNVRVQFRNDRGLTPSTFVIERIDENGKADCSYYAGGAIHEFETHFSKLMDKVLNMVSA
ncbi:hypothetical protein SAMN04487901_106101 [Prevotella communis]|uniref:KAP family P-loop domain-containing protein n=1 Tax=Prevotella communis TaxID=2913614 RepID=A0A1H0KTC0_9BACT|nr:hypothetical protein [Prevotella communis]SDG62540.1 hypothetical protein SAMN04487901_106101 [Prevotella communis]SDO59032.1 hypothetical protein SAMN04487900_1304 [Prevotella communis]